MSIIKNIDIAAIGRSVIISPHDDDGLIGCGGLINALKEKPLIAIVTDGHLGYHRVTQKGTISKIRQQEAVAAYAIVGVPKNQILFMGYPDMSLRNFQNWVTANGREGGYQKLFKILRKHKPRTVFLPSKEDFHPDHQATFDLGLVAAYQARTTLMPDLDSPIALRQIYIYQVWDHLRAVSHRFRPRAIDVRDKRHGLRAFTSQLASIVELEELGTLKYDQEVFFLHREFS